MKIRISAFITFFLKYIISLFVGGITILPIIFTIFIFPDIAMIPACIVSCLIFYLYVPRLIKLKSIYIDDEYIYISNLFKSIKINRELVDFVQRDFLFFYIIALKQDSGFGRQINFTTMIDYQTNVLFLLKKGDKFSLDELVDRVNKRFKFF